MKRLFNKKLRLTDYRQRLNKYIRQLLLFGLVLLLAVGMSKAAAESPQRDSDFVPLGVYWPGGFTFNYVPDRWQKVEEALDDLAKHNVNTVWLAHLTSAETAEFARRAAARNIYVVAALGELQGNVAEIRKGNHPPLIANTLKAWDKAPLPIAWGLGDEPSSSYMDEMAAYVKAWKTHAPGEPVTAVVQGYDIFSAAQVGGFDILCSDVYPFHRSGILSPYGGEDWAGWLKMTRNLVSQTQRPWMMGQAFQHPIGPFEGDEQGHVVYLPGSVQLLTMPTPAQIKWQAWSAIAIGAKGIFYFVYRFPIKDNVEAERWAASSIKGPPLRERLNSRAPIGLVNDDGSSTPQYEAMGQTFGELQQVTRVLAPLKPSAGPEAWIAKSADKGTIANVLVHPTTNKRYLVVVAGYEGDDTQTITITLGPHITGLKSLLTGDEIRVDVAQPFRQATVTLPQAQGDVFECEIDEDNLPASYSDDFSTDKFARDSLNGTGDGVQLFISGYGNWVAAADGQQRANAAFLTYDLDALLGPLPSEGIRTLLYSEDIKPPKNRGVSWFVSRDGQRYNALSKNEFNRGIPFSGRYLKVELSQVASEGADAGYSTRYGYLKRLTFSQWKRPAVE